MIGTNKSATLFTIYLLEGRSNKAKNKIMSWLSGLSTSAASALLKLDKKRVLHEKGKGIIEYSENTNLGHTF